MKNTMKFQKVNTTDDTEHEREVEDDIHINEIDLEVQNAKSDHKITTMVLCALMTVSLLVIAFVSGYFIHDWSNNNVSNSEQISPVDNETDTDNDHHYFIRDTSCLTRKCCKAIDITNTAHQTECSQLLLKECIYESQFCEWDCSYNFSMQSNITTTTATIKRRRRRFRGISTGVVPYNFIKLLFVQSLHFN